MFEQIFEQISNKFYGTSGEQTIFVS